MRRSLVLAFTESYAVMVLQFITTLVLSRILTPSEIGVFSVAVVLSSLANMIRDFGVGEYLIQEKDLTRDKIRAAFALNIMVSWSMGAMVFAIRSPVAAFYHEPGIAAVLTVLACNFALTPFGAVTMAYFRRELNFAPLLWAGTISTAVSATVAIVLAMNGFGFMSMAWSSLAGSICMVGIANMLRPKELPLFPGIKEVRSVFSFGTYASGIYILAQIGKSAPDLIIGRVVTMEAVGLFSRANGLIEVFYRGVMSGIVRVALPYFSAQQRSGEHARIGFLKAMSYITGVGWPFFAVLALLASPAVRLVYGSQWGGAVLPLQLLCGAFALQVTYYLGQELLIAVGRVRQSTMLQGYTQVVRIGFMLAAAPFGMIAVCVALLLASAITMAMSHWALRSALQMRVVDVVRACRGSALLTVAAFFPAAIAVHLINAQEGVFLAPFFLGSAASAVSWLAVVFLIRHPLGGELETMLRQIMVRFRPGP